MMNKMPPHTPTNLKPKESTGIVAPCQADYYLYPARLALTQAALSKIANSGEYSSPPASLPSSAEKSDYELRRLRSGFIYILAANITGCGSAQRITAKASSGLAWYIYYYHSPTTALKLNIGINSLDYCFTQYYCENEDIYQTWESAKGKSQPHIALSQLISDIEIMYSDFELPLAFLDKLATDPRLRQSWMKKVNIKEPDQATGSAPFSQLNTLVKDLDLSAPELNQNAENYQCFAPIGKIQLELEQLKYSERGIIVGLADIISNARDFVSYIQYLENQRNEKLTKYEYAISTATVIDNYVKNKATEYQRLMQRYANPYTSFEECYQTVLRPYVDSAHLDHKENDIIQALKQEFNLPDIPGYNIIHKVANLPHFFEKKFENIAKAHLSLIEKNANKLEEFLAAYESNKAHQNAQDILNGFCLYGHGLLWGLNATSFGQQTMIQTFNPNNAVLSEKLKSQVQPFANRLNTALSTILNGLSAIAALQEIRGLNVYAYDKIVTTVVAEIITGEVYQTGKKRQYPRSQRVNNITNVYRKFGFSMKEYEIKELRSALQGNIQILNPSKAPIKNKSVTLFSSTRLEIHDESYHQFQQSAGKLNGAVKLLTFLSFIGYWVNIETYTVQGKLANDSTYALILGVAAYMAPEGNLALEYRQLDRLNISLQAINKATGEAFTSRWAAMRAGLMDASLALTGIAVMFEVFLAQEAAYKGDDIDFWGAVSRGTGGSMIGLSPTFIATGVTAIAEGHVVSGSILQLLGRVFPYIGSVLVLIGMIMRLFKSEDIELWIKHGFWGNSPHYWGEAVGAYDWTLERTTKFSSQWFDVVNNKESIHEYYKIEIQRLFSLTDKPILERIDKNNIRIIHPNINNPLAIKNIRITEKIVFNNNDIYKLESELSIKYEKQGCAIITLPKNWLIYDHYNQTKREIERRYLTMIKIKVSMLRYEGYIGENIYSEPIISNLHDL
ncbi:toxin VasX [Rodentibacter caecimuris]|uniref:toxin VasX n=1 Tax=Rodentibacter caecimuris TaxID=1796644 RepID=UPI00211A25EB|nr:toxin VasX [Rodentibacter heylii]